METPWYSSGWEYLCCGSILTLVALYGIMCLTQRENTFYSQGSSVCINESIFISHCCNQSQIHILCIPACVMSSEFLTITPLTVFGRIEKLILLKIKFKKTVLAELSWIPCVWIHCSLHMQECKDETEIYNYQWIQPSNNKFINAILLVCLTCPDCNTKIIKLNYNIFIKED